MSNLEDQIKAQYNRRELTGVSQNRTYWHFADAEREAKTLRILGNYFPSFDSLTFLEVGAGQGGNIPFFHRAGIPLTNITVNELLPERIRALETNFPYCRLLPGDALTLQLSEQFDIVYQSTVFTSILNTNDRIRLANAMWNWVKPGGIILWYDFAFNNPSNPDVRKVTRNELKKLFPEAKAYTIKKLTLAPPIGRRVGKLYPYLNWPVLQTHLLAAFQKPIVSSR